MPQHSLVSVIIPAYNADKYIDETLRSVLAQSYTNIEIIVVDDGSTDATWKRLEAYGRRIASYHQPNSGGYPGIPRNTGMRRSSGDYICFIDADDVMHPERVQVQAQFLSDHPEVGCVFGNYRNFSVSGTAEESHFQTCPLLLEWFRRQSPLVLSSFDATELLLRENIGGTSTLMIRREVLACVPEFPTQFRVGEDFHFYYRISRRFSLGVIENIVCLRRLHENNITGDRLRTLHDRIRIFSALRDSESIPQHSEVLEDKLYHCEIDLARIYSNQRQYRLSVLHILRALRRGTSIQRLRRLGGILRSLLRTAAIAAHLKNPAP